MGRGTRTAAATSADDIRTALRGNPAAASPAWMPDPRRVADELAQLASRLQAVDHMIPHTDYTVTIDARAHHEVLAITKRVRAISSQPEAETIAEPLREALGWLDNCLAHEDAMEANMNAHMAAEQLATAARALRSL